MSLIVHHGDSLRENLVPVVSGEYTQEQLSYVISTCHALASAQLHQKFSCGHLSDGEGLNVRDLAYDSIAELFRRDESGQIPRIKSYFESLDNRDLADGMLIVHLRRLVFSAVNQAMFRMYSEIDPALGKIIRNIKLAVHALQNFSDIERFGDRCIAPIFCDRLEHLPCVDRDTLVRRLSDVTSGNERIPHLLAKLSQYLRQQSDHSRIIPIVLVATAFRHLYLEKQEATETVPSDHQTNVTSDVDATVRWACAEVRKRMQPKYVGKGRLPLETFERYIHVIDTYLRAKFDGVPTGQVSLFEAVQADFPGISKPEYRRRHRARLEYLARIARELVVRQLRES